MGNLGEKLDGLSPRLEAGAKCTSPLLPGAFSRLECGAGPDIALVPESVLPWAYSILRLAGWIVRHARHVAMLAFVAISRRVGPGR
ncbi:unnamed protein product, partial [marine sediment metagenome]